ncbi:hypothetical protein ABPS01_00810 [Streptococcus sp. ZJ151]|uniref:hypothetical protein n=1 Tax=Streptococcus jiangjianxini TaxID=3161189 RepID=UPI0032EB8B12
MNLNQIRILEACHRYLIDKVNDKLTKELLNDKLVFKVDNKLVTFDTFQKFSSYYFYEYQLGYYMESETYETIDIQKIFKLVNPGEGQLNTLSMLDNISKVRAHIFKILCQIDFDIFDRQIKTNNFVYNWRYLDNDTVLPIYKVETDKDFELISII